MMNSLKHAYPIATGLLKPEGRGFEKAPQGKLLRRLSARKIDEPVAIG